MKKITAFSLLLSFAPVLISFFSLTSSVSADSATNHWNSDFVSSILISDDSPVTEISINTLPILAPKESVKPLEDLQDQELQEKLDEILRSNSRWVTLSKNKQFSIGIVDMSDPLNARFAAINGNNMVYAASLPKIAVLLASEEAIENGSVKETAQVKQDMRLMIAKSSNQAATNMINRVGLKQIGQIMQDPRYNLYDKQNGGGLWVGKAYGGSNGRIGDPLKNLSHAASVMQVCKYYYMLAFGQLVSPERSLDMLNMLVDPELHHKFVSVLDRVAPNAKVYRKSGTWATWHADSALVWDKDRKYIVVALAEDASGETMLRELMLKIDTALVSKG